MTLALSSSLFLRRLPLACRSSSPLLPSLCLSSPLPSSSFLLLHTPRRAGGVVSSSSFSCRSYATSTTQSKSPKEQTKTTQTTKVDADTNYFCHTGICSIPHPSKAKKGGEDAQFISEDGTVFGVADGVGGWNDVGVDPSLYSRALMAGAKNYADKDAASREHDPADIMKAAWTHASKTTGSSTCCICVLDGTKLKVANLGDSGFTIVRDGKVLFNSEPQQHDFNFPYQLGSESSDLPEACQKFEKNVQVGDIIIAATDGVYDNISQEAIANLAIPSGDPTQIAEKIGKLARVYGERTTGRTPFAIAAHRHGYSFSGGKLDDITVVVGIVSETDTGPAY